MYVANFACSSASTYLVTVIMCQSAIEGYSIDNGLATQRVMSRYMLTWLINCTVTPLSCTRGFSSFWRFPLVSISFDCRKHYISTYWLFKLLICLQCSYSSVTTCKFSYGVCAIDKKQNNKSCVFYCLTLRMTYLASNRNNV